jgi:hypothetical protein
MAIRGDREICPTVWETGAETAVCFDVRYTALAASANALTDLEKVGRWCTRGEARAR